MSSVDELQGAGSERQRHNSCLMECLLLLRELTVLDWEPVKERGLLTFTIYIKKQKPITFYVFSMFGRGFNNIVRVYLLYNYIK